MTTPEATPEQIQATVIGALAAAGPRGNNDAAWKAKINAAIPHVAAMIGEASRQSKTAKEVLEAQVFEADYLSYEVEESSTRCLVQLRTSPSKRYPDGIEPIRTDRTDNAAGKEMQKRLDQLHEGDTILVWKAMESAGEDTKVRVLVHFEPRFRRKDGGSSAERNPPPLAEESPPPPQDEAYSDRNDTERLVEWRAKTREKLTDEQMGVVVLKLMEKGYDIDGVSEIEWVDIVRPTIRAVLDGS